MSLTHTKINKLTPSDKCKPNRPDKYSHADGLQLWVRTTGNKVWYSAYRFNGKQQTLQLGKYPALSLQEAIKRNLEVKQQVDDGIDPKAKKKADKANNDGSLLFDNIAREWHADRQVKESTQKRDLSQYERDIQPFIGNKLITEITTPDILNIAQAIEARGAGDMARRAVRQVDQIYTKALTKGIATTRPDSKAIIKALKPHKVKNHKRVKQTELPNLLVDMDNYKGDIMVKLGMWVMCYTFVRTAELRHMEWSEIDYKRKVWRISAEKMKMDRPHIVPLAPQVLKILETIKEFGFSDKYVFFNTSTGKPYSENFITSGLKNMGYRGRMTGHGYRGLASTILHEHRFLHEAIEQQLAHEKENKISKAYDGSMHLDYRIKMMNEWANYIDDVHKNGIDNLIHFDFKHTKEQQS